MVETEKPTMSRYNVKYFIMETKKSITLIVGKMKNLQEKLQHSIKNADISGSGFF